VRADKAILVSYVIWTLILAGGVSAATNISSCQTISSAGVYTLNTDITNYTSTTTCIYISTSNVVFDGQGYTLDGVDSFSYGVYVGPGISNVTVKNLRVSDWNRGIYYRQTDNGSIENVTAISNTGNGIHLWSSNNNNLINNTASNNNYGILIESSSNNTLTNSNLSNNTYNFDLTGGQTSHFNNTIDTSNTVDGKPIYYLTGVSNTAYTAAQNAGTFFCIACNNVTVRDLTLASNGKGVFFWGTNNSRVENVTVASNVNGIYLISSWNNTLVSNNASSNAQYGIYLSSSSNNTILNNTASNNNDGISLSSSYNNTVSNNTAGYNSGGGIVDNTFQGGNWITGNTLIANGKGVNARSGGTISGNQFINNTYGVYIFNENNITVDGNSFSGGSEAIYIKGLAYDIFITNNNFSGVGTAVYFYDADSDIYNVNIENNTITGATSVGISIEEQSSWAYFYNVLIRNNTIKDGGGDGIRLDGYSSPYYYTYNVTIDGNTIYNNSGNGIYGYATSGNTINGNNVSSNNYGIYLSSSINNNVSNNTASSNGNRGIYLSSSDNNVLDNNTVNSNSYGITLWSSYGNNITNNTVSSNTGTGIDLGLSSNNTIADNTVSSNNYGISIVGSRDVTTQNNVIDFNDYGIYTDAYNTPIYGNIYRGNTITNTTWYGIHFYDADYEDIYNMTLEDNVIIGSSDGIRFETTGYFEIYNISIKNSTIRNATSKGIYLTGSEVHDIAVFKNTLSDGNSGIYISSSYNNNISYNNASSNTWYGLYLTSSDGNTLSGNTLASNTWYGIYLGWSDLNTISNNTANSNGDKGIYLYQSSNNSIANNDAQNNTYGIYLDGDLGMSYNNITGNNASYNNHSGIYLWGEDNAVIKDNYVLSNKYGIYITDGSFSFSSNNLIYNNYAAGNSLANAYDDTGGKNSWNTSKTLGTNILGGSYLGGNYWGDYSGSDTNSDGIGDTLLPYNSGGNITSGGDYLPLTVIIPDTTPPNITIYSPQNTTYGSSWVDLNVSADEFINTWWYSLDGGGNTTFAPNGSLGGRTGLAEGQHHLVVYANDTSGNLNSSSVHFTVDTAPPTVNVTSLSNGSVINIFNDWLYGSALDTTTQVDLVYLTLNGVFQGTFPVNSTTGKFSPKLSYLPDAWNNITIVASDRGGNNATTSLTVFVRSNFASVTKDATANETTSVTKDATANETTIVNETLNNTDSAFEIVTTANLTFTLNVTAFGNESDQGLVPFSNASVYGFRDNETAIGKFILIETSDNINATSGNLSRVRMKLYLKLEDLDRDGDGLINGTGDVNVSALRLYWYNVTGGTWNPLTPGADYEIEGPFVHDSGVDTGSQPYTYYIVNVWAELSHFSVYGIGSTVYGVQASVYGVSASVEKAEGEVSPRVTTAQGEAKIITGNVVPGKPQTYAIPEGPEIYIIKVELEARKWLSGTITIRTLSDIPTGVSALPDRAFKYFDISPHQIRPEEVKTVRFSFRVRRSWLDENGIDPATVGLYRFTTGWDRLDTTKVGEDATFVYYSAASPGFSYYVITGGAETVEESMEAVATTPPPTTRPPTATQAPTLAPEKQVQTTQAPTPGPEEGGGGPKLLLVLLLLAVVGVVLYVLDQRGIIDIKWFKKE
jgi:PGF-pre-PGF domain-containing protein